MSLRLILAEFLTPVLLLILSAVPAPAAPQTSLELGDEPHLVELDLGYHVPEELGEKAPLEDVIMGAASRGEGLGLAVVKTMAEEHSLKLNIQSVPGRGSTFEVVGIPRVAYAGSV